MSAARDRVVEAAGRLFAEHGYDGASMRDLADDLGMQAPSIYSHFPSKVDLLLACLTPLMDEVDALLSAAPPVPVSDGDVRDWVEAYIQLGVDHRVAATLLMIDPAVRAEPRVLPRMLEESARLAAMLELFGSPDRTTTIAILGAICLPVVEGVVGAGGVRPLAASVLQWLDRAAPGRTEAAWHGGPA